MRQRKMAIPKTALGVYSPAITTVVTPMQYTGLFIVIRHGNWPDCDRCKQSCQSVYNGRPTCRRCASNRRLNP